MPCPGLTKLAPPFTQRTEIIRKLYCCTNIQCIAIQNTTSEHSHTFECRVVVQFFYTFAPWINGCDDCQNAPPPPPTYTLECKRGSMRVPIFTQERGGGVLFGHLSREDFLQDVAWERRCFLINNNRFPRLEGYCTFIVFPRDKGIGWRGTSIGTPWF